VNIQGNEHNFTTLFTFSGFSGSLRRHNDIKHVKIFTEMHKLQLFLDDRLKSQDITVQVHISPI